MPLYSFLVDKLECSYEYKKSRANEKAMTSTRPRRHSRVQKTIESRSKQKTMDDGKLKCTGLSYLVETFRLNSADRRVNRRGTSPQPTTGSLFPHMDASSGRKMRVLDLQTVQQHFTVFVSLVNQVIEKVYSSQEQLRSVGRALSGSRGQGYVVLKGQPYLAYKENEEVRSQCFERMYRNVLERAARIILSDWIRRELMTSALSVLSVDETVLFRSMVNRHIPPDLIRRARKECPVVKDNGKGFYYALSVLRQLRKALDEQVPNARTGPLGRRGQQRRRVQELLGDAHESDSTKQVLLRCVSTWSQLGFPFATPLMSSFVEDFSGSTENTPGQGYWYSLDRERENEVLFFLKLPEPLTGQEHRGSPYRTQTLAFRFLDWLPRAARDDMRRAERADRDGHHLRSMSFRMRAAKFRDMHEQLVNKVTLQAATHRLSLLRARSSSDPELVKHLTEEVARLQETRRCGPPRLVMRNHRLERQIPFLPPTRDVVNDTLGPREHDTNAGADRGLRQSIAVSVEGGRDMLISCAVLMRKRESLRHQTRVLSSEVRRRRNDWDRKKHGLTAPGHILKKERHLSSLWAKVRRVDKEIARHVSSRLVWFCEEHSVKTLYMEDLKGYQPPAGNRTLLWNMSTNLWSKVLDTTRYMRQVLGHAYGGIWTVNPAWTSRRCHICGERGIRVERADSTTEVRGGEYFYCSSCDIHILADINAARNLSQSSAVPRRTQLACPTLSTIQ